MNMGCVTHTNHFCDQGFGIIEYMIAMAIFIIVALSFSNLYTNALLARERTNQKQQAIFIAKAGLEQAMNEVSKNPAWRTGFTNVAYNQGRYTVTVTDPNTDGGIPPGLVKLESTGMMKSQSSTLSTLLWVE